MLHSIWYTSWAFTKYTLLGQIYEHYKIKKKRLICYESLYFPPTEGLNRHTENLKPIADNPGQTDEPINTKQFVLDSYRPLKSWRIEGEQRNYVEILVWYWFIFHFARISCESRTAFILGIFFKSLNRWTS